MKKSKKSKKEISVHKPSQDYIDAALKFCTRQIDTLGHPLADDALFTHLDDSNSSLLREAVLAHVANLKWCSEKHGPDAMDPVTGKNYEIKPKRGDKSPFKGGGSFSDLTEKRIEAMKTTNDGMIVGLFVERRLVLALEFLLSDIMPKLEAKVIKECVEGKNRYARSSGFDYRNYKDSKNLKIIYIDEDMIAEYECIHHELYDLILSTK